VPFETVRKNNCVQNRDTQKQSKIRLHAAEAPAFPPQSPARDGLFRGFELSVSMRDACAPGCRSSGLRPRCIVRKRRHDEEPPSPLRPAAGVDFHFVPTAPGYSSLSLLDPGLLSLIPAGIGRCGWIDGVAGVLDLLRFILESAVAGFERGS
jgi:hypothetical protein